jgi:hypothetical protein
MNKPRPSIKASTANKAVIMPTTYDQVGVKKTNSKTAITTQMIPTTNRIVAFLVTTLGLALRGTYVGGGGG